MTTTTEQSEALARLREIIKPGGTVQFVGRGITRSGVVKVTVHAARQNVTPDVAGALALRLIPRACITLSQRTTAQTVDLLLDRLSVALFGEPGQIKGEML